MIKKISFIIILAIVIVIVLTVTKKNDNNDTIVDIDVATSGELIEEKETPVNNADESKLKSVDDINLHDIDGNGKKYSFTYNNEEFNCKFSKDTWHIENSYKIQNQKDIAIICQALINEHPIPSSDGTSFRTIEDLVYEWVQHNVAYSVLPEDNSWKAHAKDVDLDPKDQGKSLKEMYESRTGKKFDINDI